MPRGGTAGVRGRGAAAREYWISKDLRGLRAAPELNGTVVRRSQDPAARRGVMKWARGAIF